jgi:hypothetical protein
MQQQYQPPVQHMKMPLEALHPLPVGKSRLQSLEAQPLVPVELSDLQWQETERDLEVKSSRRFVSGPEMVFFGFEIVYLATGRECYFR